MAACARRMRHRAETRAVEARDPYGGEVEARLGHELRLEPGGLAKEVHLVATVPQFLGKCQRWVDVPCGSAGRNGHTQALRHEISSLCRRASP